MKHLTYTLILVAALSLFTENSLVAKKPPTVTPPSATITASPSIYTSGTPLTFTGSGFAPGISVFIDVQGINYFTFYTTPDSSGNADVYYPGGVLFPAGVYTITATQTVPTNGNKTTTLSAASGFEVQ